MHLQIKSTTPPQRSIDRLAALVSPEALKSPGGIMSADAMRRGSWTSRFFFGNHAGICAGAVGCHAFQIVVSQTRPADDVTRHGADWNCVRVVLGMDETNCNVASNFDCNHSHDFCALVVAHSLMTASIRQQPIEPFGYLALGDGAARLGHSLARSRHRLGQPLLDQPGIIMGGPARPAPRWHVRPDRRRQ